MHDELVADIASKVEQFYKQRQPFRIFHGSTNSTRIQHFKKNETLDVSQLNNVLHVDTEKQTALTEPNVSMSKLLDTTLKYGLIPKVVMELPSITVGGGIQGVGEESSSYKYGCFSETCNSYELILGNGAIITASAEENSDLFYGMPGTYGSLGVLTAAEVQLVTAKRYVQLTYMPTSTYSEALSVMQTSCNNTENDFVEGILFAKNKGVIITGKLTNETSGKVEQFSRAQDDWFYLHACKMLTREKRTVTVPIRDYLFRYDRGAFWTGQYTFERAGYPFNRFTRWLLNPLLHANKLYEALQQTNAAQQYIVQDVVVPVEQGADFLNYLEKQFGQYPLWLCPLKPNSKSPFSVNNVKTALAINIGVWLGKRYENLDEFISLNHKLERRLEKYGGKKWLYAHSYYTADEFWGIYGKDWYSKLRTKYHAENLPDVYEKTASKVSSVKSVKKAAFKTLLGRSKLRISP